MFDFDGVIVNSLDHFATRFLSGCYRLGVEQVKSRDDFLSLFDGNLHERLAAIGIGGDEMVQILGTPEEGAAAALAEVALMPDMRAALAKLAEQHTLLVITSNLGSLVTAYLRAHGVDCFAEIIGSEEEPSKRRKIIAARRRYRDLEPVYIGDTGGDIAEGRAAGVTTVAATWGWHSAEHLRRFQPDHLVHTPADLYRLFSVSVINRQLNPGDAMPTPSASIEWIDLRPGTCTRGAMVTDACLDLQADGPDDGPHWDESPVHELTLTYAYRIAAAPLTNTQYAAYDPAHRGRVEQRGLAWQPEAPVELVTWHDAVSYCAWLSETEGKLYRLPTEAEWDVAAQRGGEHLMVGATPTFYEWCHDWWAPYPKGPQTDPMGPAEGTVRIIRGGRLANRGGSIPEDRRPTLGFRVVQAPWPETVPAPPAEAAAPFQNVSQQEKRWPTPSGEPFFSGGSPFIVPPADPVRLPYFGRHHVPSLTWCNNGDLLATAFTAPFDRSQQMAILITRLRAGRTNWDPAARFFVAPDRNVTSAALYHAPNGEIHHYNGLGGFGDARSTAFSMVKRTSDDHGATWSAPRLVHEYPAHRASPETLTGEPRLWPHMDVVVLPDGTLIMPSDSGPGQDQGSVGSVLFASHDNGETWTERTRFGWNSDGYAQPAGEAGWIAGIHAPFVVLNDGRWLALGRGNNIADKAPWSFSADEGRTWRYAASPFPPLHSGQRPVMLRLQEGPILLVSFTGKLTKSSEPTPIEVTDAMDRSRSALGMFAALSYDEGQCWSQIKMVPIDPARPGESEQRGYLSCLQTPDKMVHLLNSRRYYRFNLAWLESPAN